jgi:hypothetical protein
MSYPLLESYEPSAFQIVELRPGQALRIPLTPETDAFLLGAFQEAGLNAMARILEIPFDSLRKYPNFGTTQTKLQALKTCLNAARATLTAKEES